MYSGEACQSVHPSVPSLVIWYEIQRAEVLAGYFQSEYYLKWNQYFR